MPRWANTIWQGFTAFSKTANKQSAPSALFLPETCMTCYMLYVTIIRKSVVRSTVSGRENPAAFAEKQYQDR